MSKRQRMEEGTYRHRCESCIMTSPPIRHYLDDEDELQVIDNHWTCENGITQFSIGAMGYHKTLKKLSDIERACSKHSNWHVHRWAYLKPFTEVSIDSIRLLNDAEDVIKAYDESIKYVLYGAFERREAWHQRKP